MLEELKTSHKVPCSRTGKSTGLTEKAVGETWWWPTAPGEQENTDCFSQSVVGTYLSFFLLT